MKLEPAKNYRECLRVSKKSMRAYYTESGIDWDDEKWLRLYATLEVYDVFDDSLIGHLAFREHKEKLYLADVQIHDEYRNRGYGTRLLEQVRIIAKDKGYSELFLRVFKTNPALYLYLRNGYVQFQEEHHTRVLVTEL